MNYLMFDSHTVCYAKHLVILAVRFVCAASIAIALPESHLRWNESLHGGDCPGGLTGMGFLITFFFISSAVSVAYFAMGSIVHHFLRKQLWAVVAIDTLLFVALGGLLVYAGVNAVYE